MGSCEDATLALKMDVGVSIQGIQGTSANEGKEEQTCQHLDLTILTQTCKVVNLHCFNILFINCDCNYKL